MSDRTRYRIVIADDEGVIRLGLRTMVRALGHTVVGTARNGVEAVNLVRQLSPDLLLLDIKMPKMDGIAVAEKLSAEMPLPIVMLTAFSEQSLVAQAAAAAVMGYLVKPVDETKLAPMLELAIARFAERKAAQKQAETLTAKLSARDSIERAKKILMARGLTEREAYHQLQATARAERKSIAAVAEDLLLEIG
ncbi:MAG TPA: response regulator [Anaerolineae bacterium]|nr:response regulator [Anaerolineae bacterium]